MPLPFQKQQQSKMTGQSTDKGYVLNVTSAETSNGDHEQLIEPEKDDKKVTH